MQRAGLYVKGNVKLYECCRVCYVLQGRIADEWIAMTAAVSRQRLKPIKAILRASLNRLLLAQVRRILVHSIPAHPWSHRSLWKSIKREEL